jgi:hypothetical protein
LAARCTVSVSAEITTRRSNGTRPRGSTASGTCASSSTGVSVRPYSAGNPVSAARAQSQADPAMATATAPTLAPSAKAARPFTDRFSPTQRTSFARRDSSLSGRARAGDVSPSAARNAQSVLSNVPRAPATNTWKPRLSNSLPQN